jgi:hypothetical protein
MTRRDVGNRLARLKGKVEYGGQRPSEQADRQTKPGIERRGRAGG